MSLFSSLNAASQGLDAQSYAIGIAGKNLSNINNASYSKETVVFSNDGSVNTVGGPVDLGVSTSVVQESDPLLNAQVASENSTTSSFSTQQQFLEEAQTALGENLSNTSASSSTSSTGVGSSGLSSQIDNFFNAVQSLAASPGDATKSQVVLAQASVLAETFQQTNSNLAQVRGDLNTEIQSSVADANSQLQKIASLNQQIAQFEAGNPGSALDLRDQRQAAIEQLANDVPITTTAGPNGSVQISMKDGSGNPVALVSGSTVTGPLTFSGSTLSGGASATALQISSGSIYGALNVRDGELSQIQSSIDAVANQIVTSVNAAYSATGGSFFDPAGTTAGTIAVSANLAANPPVAGVGAAGDNSVALAVAAVANTAYSTGSGDAITGTIGGYYDAAVSNLGESVSNMNNLVDSQTAVQNLAQTQRSNVSGVSMNEEMGNLMKYENAFQANARVFSVINTMISSLVNDMGVGT